MKYSAVIIEDEKPARDTLKSYLERYFETIHVVAEIDNVQETINFLTNNSVDILFLDVQLKDGKALDVLNRVDVSEFKLIFTTAFDEYTLDAFRYKSYGYLLKPLDPDDFIEILGRVISVLNTEAVNETKQIKIPVSSGNKWVNLKDVIRCESESNYTKIYCKGELNPLVISKTLKYVEAKIINSPRFIRVHRTHLINLDYLINSEIKQNKITLSNGKTLPVSRSKRDQLISVFKDLSL